MFETTWPTKFFIGTFSIIDIKVRWHNSSEELHVTKHEFQLITRARYIRIKTIQRRYQVQTRSQPEIPEAQRGIYQY